MDCRHAALQNITNCDMKVGVNCPTQVAGVSRICENGELRRNETNKLLQICHNGAWVPLCPDLWQASSQAMVACRQLYPNKTVLGKLLTLRMLSINIIFYMQKVVLSLSMRWQPTSLDITITALEMRETLQIALLVG